MSESISFARCHEGILYSRVPGKGVAKLVLVGDKISLVKVDQDVWLTLRRDENVPKTNRNEHRDLWGLPPVLSRR